MAQEDTSASTFEENYSLLLTLTDKSSDSDYLSALSPYLKDFANIYDFSKYKEVNEENNTKIFCTLSKLLSNKLNDIKNVENKPLICSCLSTYRILFRSKIGLKPVLSQSFHTMLIKCLSHFTLNKEIQMQCLACIIGTITYSVTVFQDISKICTFSSSIKSYNVIIKFLMNTIETSENDTSLKEKDTLRLFCIHILCSLTCTLNDTSIAKDIYENDAFFHWLYQLYLTKSQYFSNAQYWHTHDKDKKKKSSSTTSQQQESTKIEENEFVGSVSWRDDCCLINEICRLLFNFTMVETKVLQYKLDKFERAFQFAVVIRTCDILSLPLNYDFVYKAVASPVPSKTTNSLTIKQYQRQVKNWMKVSLLCDEPCLISVKLNLCNVSLYSGDIIGMNLKTQSCQPLAELLDFRAVVTRGKYQRQELLCPMLLFMKEVVSFNPTVRAYMKSYIFKKDAIATSDSDSDSNKNKTNGGQPDITSKLDKVGKKGTTLRNLFISYMTSTSSNVKTAMGEFFLHVCDDDPDEMIRLVGFGAGVGHLVNKGVPGYAEMAKQGVNLEQMAALKKKSEKANKNKSKKVKDKADGKQIVTRETKEDGQNEKSVTNDNVNKDEFEKEKKEDSSKGSIDTGGSASSKDSKDVTVDKDTSDEPSAMSV